MMRGTPYAFSVFRFRQAQTEAFGLNDLNLGSHFFKIYM